MIFYETVFTRVPSTGYSLVIDIPMTYASETEARKAFNKEKRAMKKRNLYDECCAVFKVEANTDLDKSAWLRLFLGDAPGHLLIEDKDPLYIRDLIRVRHCIDEYST